MASPPCLGYRLFIPQSLGNSSRWLKKDLDQEAIADMPWCYQAGILALLLSDLHDPKKKDRDFKRLLQQIADAIIRGQTPSGSWGYKTGKVGANFGDENNSTAQYALLGLQAASNRGAEVPEKVWRRAALYFLDTQQPIANTKDYSPKPGGWGYARNGQLQPPADAKDYTARVTNPLGNDGLPYGSMTAVGVASLLICAEHIPEEDPLQRRIRAGVDAGIAWLATNFSVKEHPGVTQAWGTRVQPQFCLYYYLYSLERTGSFAATNHFGDHAWYKEGARFLVDQLMKDGAWGRTSDSEPPFRATPFALLFLKRASAGLTKKGSYPVEDIKPAYPVGSTPDPKKPSGSSTKSP